MNAILVEQKCFYVRPNINYFVFITYSDYILGCPGSENITGNITILLET